MQPWDFSRLLILYAPGKIGNLIRVTFAYTCVECTVSMNF